MVVIKNVGDKKISVDEGVTPNFVRIWILVFVVATASACFITLIASEHGASESQATLEGLITFSFALLGSMLISLIAALSRNRNFLNIRAYGVYSSISGVEHVAITDDPVKDNAEICRIASRMENELITYQKEQHEKEERLTKIAQRCK